MKYKTATLTCKVLAHDQLLYLSHLLTPYTPAWALCSQHKQLLYQLFPQSYADEVSVTQRLQYGMKSLSKFTVALPWLLLRSILRHIILLVPSLSATTPSSP